MPSSTLSNESGRSVVLSSTPSTMRDSLMRRGDRTDLFTLNLTARSSFKTDLKGIARSANVDLELLDSRRRVIAASRNPGRSNESIAVSDLAAGTYYLRTKLKSGDRSNYRLQSSAIDLTDSGVATLPDLAGNSLDTARNLVLSNAPTSVRDYVGVGDAKDWYKFSVGGEGNPSAKLNLSMTGLDGAGFSNPVSVVLRDSLNNVVKTAYSYDGAAINFANTVPAGNYSLEVKPVYNSGRVSYDLALSTQAIADAAGNSVTTARTITASSSESLFSDFVGSGDKDDWYKFTLTSTRNLRLGLSGPGGDLLGAPVYTELRTATASGAPGEILWTDARYDGSGFSRNTELTAGTYFIKLSSIYGDNSANFDQAAFYDLKLSTSPVIVMA
jgi:hypothetical protein